MIPYKIIVTTEDFAQLFDCSLGVAKNHMSNIRKVSGKSARAKVSAAEVADYSGIDRNEVLKALNREHW
jgi:hypothetical protein